MAWNSDVRCVGSGRRGYLDGSARDAELNRPSGICALRDGTLAFTDAHNNAVRFVTPAAGRRRCYVKTVECSGLLNPKGIAVSSDERHLFVCDTGHHKIKLAALPSRSALAEIDEVTDGVEMFAFAGSGKKGWRDGAALEASFNSPAGVCEYIDGSIIVADTGNHCIRQIRWAGKGKLVVRTIAGAYAKGIQRTATVSKDKRVSGYRDGVHSLFRSPSAILSGPNGELLVADTMNNCIRGLYPLSDGTWNVSKVCGQIRPGHADGNCEVALFDQPFSLCWGENSNTFFVADRGNDCIRQVGRSYGDGLTFAWVNTIEVGGISRPVHGQELYPCSHPLGIVYIPQPSKLVVCDGEDNMIKILPLEELVIHQALDVEEGFNSTKLSEPSIFSQRGSDYRSYYNDSMGPLSPKACYTDSEGVSENQLGNEDGSCSCEASQALNEALQANAALQDENLRLRELLQCTFDEIELADKRFSKNYQLPID